MLKIITLALIALCPTSIFATGDSLRYLAPGDTILLNVENNEKIFIHEIEKGQTLFSLAKFYGLHLEELRYYNPSLGDQIPLGQKIRIPIPNRAIIRYLDKKTPKKDFVPVYYQVKKGDTVFRISQYFKMPVDTVNARAKIKNNNIQPDQRIPIGWMSIKGIPETIRPEPTNPVLKANLPYRQRYEARAGAKKIITTQGPAFWQKNVKEEHPTFFARFNDLPAGSVIEIINPMNESKIFAEVLGPIPPSVYNKNIVVVLSPSTAKMLGARDAQFFVKVRYYK